MRLLARLLLTLFLGLAPLTAVPVLAQEQTEAIDYEAWDAVAKRAEAAVEAGRASNDALEALRAEIVEWRDKLLKRQKTNTERVKTIRAQIEALGPLPEDNSPEPAEIAERRRSLNKQLAEAVAPVTKAEEGFRRADGIAREIDAIIRERQANALFTLGPTPLNPALWPAAITAVTSTGKALTGEFVDSWTSDAKREALMSDLPKTLLYLVIAVLLLSRGRAVMERLTARVFQRSIGRATNIAGFATSLGQIVVPVTGLYLLVEALQSTALLGLRGTILTDLLPVVGFFLFFSRWLGLRLFPKAAEVPRVFAATPEQGRAVRVAAMLLGLLAGVMTIVSTLSAVENYSDATAAVVIFPAVALVGLVLLRLGRVLAAIARPLIGSETAVFGARGLALVGRLTAGVGVIGLTMTAVGYLNAGLFLLLPTAQTLAIFGLLLVLAELVRDLYAFATRASVDEARAALVPTLINFALVTLSLPLMALIWGARTADLTEMWARVRQGFDIGETHISPENFLTFALVFSGLYAGTRIVQNALRTIILPKTRVDTGGQNAIVSGVGYVGIFTAAMVAITTAGIDLSSLAIVAGALSVGIGFGLQNIVQNFVSGIILLIERPVAEGDWIEVGGHMGTVRKISVRSTLIETFDRTEVVVPNGDFIAGAVTNWTRTNTIGRVKVQVGVAYGTDTRKVERILKEIAMEHPLVTLTPEPGVDFLGFGADSLDFQIRAVVSDVNFGIAVQTEIRHRIVERFAEEGIEIPFAQRVVWIKNPEAAQAALVAREEAAPSNLRREHMDDGDLPGMGDGEGDGR